MTTRSHYILDNFGQPILDMTGDPIQDTFADAAFGDADYLGELSSLMPRGRAWPRDPSSVQMQFWQGLASIMVDVDVDAQQLLVDANPNTTYNLLPEWEETLGLPDPCLGASPTVAQRQGSVRAKFNAIGGLSYGFYEAYAAALGYTITITPQAPFRMGINGMGDPIGPEEWFFVANISSVPPVDSVLKCEMNNINAAHQVFTYS